METAYVCILTVMTVLAMVIWLVAQYHKANRGQEDKIRSVERAMDGVLVRVKNMEEAQRKALAAEQPKKKEGGHAPLAEVPLTVDGIIECVRGAGFEPERSEDSVSFMRDGELNLIDTSRLPQLFILKGYLFDPQEYDLDAMRRAAHQMSDQVIMVKAFIGDEPDSEGKLRMHYFLAAMDRTLTGFRKNLRDYLRIMDDGQQSMSEIYDRLINAKKDAASLNSLADESFQRNGKTLS